MKAELDAAGARNAPNLTQRQHVESRQQQWLCELERAGLNAGARTARGGDVGAAVRANAPAPAVQRGALADAGHARVQPGAAIPASQGASAAAVAQRQAVALTPAQASATAPLAYGAGALRAAGGSASDARAAQAPMALAAALTGPPLAWTAARLADAAAPLRSALHDGAQGQAAPAPVGSDDAYGQRQMHVFHGVDGVQAWVRDAAVGNAQAVLLGTAIGAELAAAGHRLSALTVNGRKVSLNTPDPADDGLHHPGSDGSSTPIASPNPHAVSITLNGAV